MFGMRCESCGEVRWSLLGRAEGTPSDCPACGTEMVEERRHPGRRARIADTERRDRSEPVRALSAS